MDMKKTKESFEKTVIRSIEKTMRDKVGKYLPKMMRVTSGNTGPDYMKKLIHDFVSDDFLPCYERYYQIWFLETERQFDSFLGASVKNFLKEKAERAI